MGDIENHNFSFSKINTLVKKVVDNTREKRADFSKEINSSTPISNFKNIKKTFKKGETINNLKFFNQKLERQVGLRHILSKEVESVEIIRKNGTQITGYRFGKDFHSEYGEYISIKTGDSIKITETNKTLQSKFLKSTPKFPRESKAVNTLLDFIGEIESTGNHNALCGYPAQSNIDYSNKTFGEILKIQDELVKNGRNSAIGCYQIIRKSLIPKMEKLKIDKNQKFTPQMNHQIGLQFLIECGLRKYQKGIISAERFLTKIAYVWAAVPKPNGESAYNGIGANRALTTPKIILEKIKAIRTENSEIQVTSR